jgi:hypothetical protein
LRAPGVADRLAALGLEPAWSPAPALAKRIADDTATWRRIVEASGFTTEE